MEMSLDVDDSGLKGIWQKWTLLRNFSPDVITQYDYDYDGVFNDLEQSEIYQNAFSNAKKYHYFTFIDIDGSTYVPSTINDFTAVIDGDDVIYSFYIPCGFKALPTYTSLDIVTYDPTSYVSFGFLNLDDPYNDTVSYMIDFLRDGNIYSHTNDLGQLHLLIDMKLRNNQREKVLEDKTIIDLAPIASLPKIPEQTVYNPFISSGTLLQSDIQANPFLR